MFVNLFIFLLFNLSMEDSLKFEIKKIKPNWGAIITGIDLSKKVDQDTKD